MEEKNQSVSGEIPEDLIHQIVTAARTGDQAGSARLFNRFLQLLQQEIVRGTLGKEGLSKVSYSLETLLGMQQMEDWVAFADILEFELLPLWKTYGCT